jgi:hypothetical protein
MEIPLFTPQMEVKGARVLIIKSGKIEENEFNNKVKGDALRHIKKGRAIWSRHGSVR